MIERGEQNFVARLQFARNGARDGKGDRGHVLAKNHFVFFTVEKIGHGRAGIGDHLVIALAGEEGTAGVGVGAHQIPLNRVHHLRGDLRAGGAIEKRCRLAVNLRLQGRKLRTYPGDIKRIAGRQNNSNDAETVL